MTTSNAKVPTNVTNAADAVIRHTFSKVAMMLPLPNICAWGKTKMAILYLSVRCRTFPQKKFWDVLATETSDTQRRLSGV